MGVDLFNTKTNYQTPQKGFIQSNDRFKSKSFFRILIFSLPSNSWWRFATTFQSALSIHVGNLILIQNTLTFTYSKLTLEHYTQHKLRLKCQSQSVFTHTHTMLQELNIKDKIILSLIFTLLFINFKIVYLFLVSLLFKK